ncbi:lipopolysaccharide assembly protein LapB [Halodesulfovibrio sp. MK-HDV]|jgi:tetratricopeptide (TPR) repeat protein|uniref:tetratricopeptide repeat protein n=1 Tax=Halodesulfovibrio sp. MK-HDV TaxID=2599925 RepID=UPI0013686F6F|nr:tetratricopeptide repeat protein [Halodesulfovibrio sp. MK-HDV]KAF1074466.1 Lipopolysaccharide assembly protein B [Halodesulfovibrio sp. MK-HDV]
MNRSVLLLLVMVIILISGCMQSETEDELSKARKAFINKEYTEAERFYQRYLRDNDDGAERWKVWNRLVEITGTVRGNKNRAIELLDAMLLEYSGDSARYRQILISKGNMFIESGLWSEATIAWSQLLSAPEVTIDEEATAYANLGKAYLMRGDYGLAVDAFKDCRELEYDNPEHKQYCIYDLSQAYAYLGNYIEAEQNLNNLLQYEGVEVTLMARAKLLLADIYEQQEKPRKAITLLQEIRDTYPNPRVVEFRLKNLQK